MSSSPLVTNTLARARLDWMPGGEPASPARTTLAATLAVVVALACNAGLVRIATTWSPSLRTYAHFRVVDYGSLTVLGVVGAGVTWFVVSRISSSPRWFFVRLAVVVTIVLLAPDVWIIAGHEPVRAVATLMAMHVVMALVTYHVMVRVAPVRTRARTVADPSTASRAPVASLDPVEVRDGTTRLRYDAHYGRRTWLTMASAVGVEAVVGMVELFDVPFGRPNGFFIAKGEVFSLLHGLVGGFLGIGATAIVLLAGREDRFVRMAAIGGFFGVALGAVGGTLCYYHSLRIVGMVLMFVGASVGFFSYLIPLIGDGAPVAPPSR
jgi:hypothetical protein